MFDKNILRELQTALTSLSFMLGQCRALIGFDGYIDKLVRLKKNQNLPPEYFQSIGEFSGRITSHSNQSCDIEVDCISEKMGGNGPLLADALAVKGMGVTCVGAFGYPEIQPHFEQLANRCTAISIENPANTYAMEFSDGKLMFGDSNPLSRIDFTLLCDRVGLNRIHDLADQSDLLCFTNWSGLVHSNSILEGFLTDICPLLCKKKRMLFFDLADPSQKTQEQFEHFFKLLKKARHYFWVIVGLNPNECRLLYNHFFSRDEAAFSEHMLEELRNEFPADEIVYHGIDTASAGTKDIPMEEVHGERVKHPKIVTGGGDNFNSGYCAGKLMGLPTSLCACLGNLSSMLYVADGVSPDMVRIIEEIQTRLSN